MDSTMPLMRRLGNLCPRGPAARPCLRAFRRTRNLPDRVIGPVLRRALRRLVAALASDVPSLLIVDLFGLKLDRFAFLGPCSGILQTLEIAQEHIAALFILHDQLRASLDHVDVVFERCTQSDLLI